MFGIEHYWGNQWERIAGYINDHGTQKVKLTWGTEDGSTAEGYNETGAGYISVGLTPGGTSGGYVSSATLTAYGLVSQTASGSSTTYECDGFWFNNGQTNYALVGGCSWEGALCGAFCSNVNNVASNSWWNIGCCLTCCKGTEYSACGRFPSSRVGGPCIDGALCGAFYSNLNSVPSHTNWNIGCCLVYCGNKYPAWRPRFAWLLSAVIATMVRIVARSTLM